MKKLSFLKIKVIFSLGIFARKVKILQHVHEKYLYIIFNIVKVTI